MSVSSNGFLIKIFSNPTGSEEESYEAAPVGHYEGTLIFNLVTE